MKILSILYIGIFTLIILTQLWLVYKAGDVDGSIVVGFSMIILGIVVLTLLLFGKKVLIPKWFGITYSTMLFIFILKIAYGYFYSLPTTFWRILLIYGTLPVLIFYFSLKKAKISQ
jgi:chromate transport protein ChrA